MRCPYLSNVRPVITFVRVDDSNLGNWTVILSCGCYHFYIANSSVGSTENLDYSADSPLAPESATISHSYYVGNARSDFLHATSFSERVREIHP